MTREDLNTKLDNICAGVISDKHSDRIRDAWWNVEQAADVSEPIKTMDSFRSISIGTRD
jgi:hypothetical protein